jgi:hypothetical protein
MCGCEICISVHSIQKSLNAFRHRFMRTLTGAGTLQPTMEHQTYIDTVLPCGDCWHEKPRHVIKEIQCASCGYPHWRCVLQRCAVCPEFQVPNLETHVDEHAKMIKFHSYCKATKCSDHGDHPLNANHCDGCNLLKETSKKGRVRSQKYLTLLTRPIGIFMEDFYIPLLKK